MMTLFINFISKLSRLKIDADKDWQVKGISNLKELAAGMTVGDVLVKGAGGVIIKISPGYLTQQFTSNGPGHVPSWQDPPGP